MDTRWRIARRGGRPAQVGSFAITRSGGYRALRDQLIKAVPSAVSPCGVWTAGKGGVQGRGRRFAKSSGSMQALKRSNRGCPYDIRIAFWLTAEIDHSTLSPVMAAGSARSASAAGAALGGARREKSLD